MAFILPDILIKYRVDKRIKVAEISYKSKKFLVDLDEFMEQTGVRDFEESNSGEAYIGVLDYTRLRDGAL